MSGVYIIGTIGLDVTAQEIRNQLLATDSEVELYIDSPGGDVIESNGISLALAEYALEHPEKKFVCTIGALCASAAANILAKLPACYTIKAYKDTLIMYHSCSGIFEGNPEQLRDYGVMMSLVNEAVIRELINKTNLDSTEIKSAFTTGRELWLDGQKALECGLVNELLDADSQHFAYNNNEGTKKILAMVAQYKLNMERTKMDETLETKEVIETPETPIEAETELEKEEIAEEIAEEINEKPEVDYVAECEELKAENEELKKELEALKALVAKYTPTAKPTATKAVKADWLTMVRELNAKHLNEKEYEKEYIALKNAHKNEFTAFMQSRTTR